MEAGSRTDLDPRLQAKKYRERQITRILCVKEIKAFAPIPDKCHTEMCTFLSMDPAHISS